MSPVMISIIRHTMKNTMTELLTMSVTLVCLLLTLTACTHTDESSSDTDSDDSITVIVPTPQPLPAETTLPTVLDTAPQEPSLSVPPVRVVKIATTDCFVQAPLPEDTLPQPLPEDSLPQPLPEDTLQPLLQADTLPPLLQEDTLPQPQEMVPYMALRTNLLYDAVLIPNIGLEVALGDHWSLAADWFYNWIHSDEKHLYWQGYGGYLSLRYYFLLPNSRDNTTTLSTAEQRLTGHHVGIYGLGMTYDVEFGGRGYQAARFGFGGGIEYGYSLPVAPSLTLDFNLGVGFQGGEYKVYQPTDDGTGHYVWLATRKRRWWGPTKAEISLKWLLSAPQEKKGGDR